MGGIRSGPKLKLPFRHLSDVSEENNYKNCTRDGVNMYKNVNKEVIKQTSM